jgi:hypothetical protein
LRFATTGSTGVIYNSGTSWALLLSASDSASAKLQLLNSASTVVAEVSGLSLGESSYYSTVVQNLGTSVSLDVRRYVGDTAVYATSSITTNAALLTNWLTGSRLHIGGSGSTFGPSYVGYIDEFRMWGEALSSSVIDDHARNPAAYYGNNSASAYAQLFARLSFNVPMNFGSASTTYAWNESPYVRFDTLSPSMTYFSASNFSNQTTYPYSTKVTTRQIYRLAQTGGATQYSTNKVVIAPDATLRAVSINGSSVPVLSRTRSIVSLNDKSKYRTAQNKIGIYVSTTDAVNDSIIRTMGQLNYQAALGDPQALYSSSYTDLVALNNLYWTKYAYSYDVNKLQKVVRNILGPLFSQLPSFLPAKAKLVTGIVVEPHILERNRIKTREVKLSGQDARNADDTLNRFVKIPGRIASSPSGSLMDMDLYYNTVVSSSLQVDNDFAEARVYTSRSMDFGAENLGFEDRIYTSQSYDFGAERLDWDGYINLKGTLLTKYRNIIGDSNITWITSPLSAFCNLDTVSSTTYFYNTGGVYPTTEIRKVRQNDAALTYKGTWAKGVAYVRNDVVLQSNSGSDGNNTEYRCMTSNILATFGSSTGSVVGFISNIPPFYDTTNWVPVSYIPKRFRTIKKVVDISGSLALVSTGSSIPPFVGYHPDHYKFMRDNGTATRRRNYYGCKNTIDTTLDGKDPVETYIAPGDRLYATQTSEPIQQNKDNSGPLLDVR